MTAAEANPFAVDTDSTTNDRPKIFQDSVHGPIELHPLLVAIVDTPEFQRLRYIKQLSLTYWVFPAACHHRFEHSLGVCHLARKMLQEIEHNSPEVTGAGEMDDRKKQECKAAWEKEKLCVQIAGLCHDIGHGPFSHTWESFVRASGHEWSHEETSGEMLDYMLLKYPWLKDKFNKFGIGPAEVKLIKEFIVGEGESLDKSRMFLYQIVSNKTNDVDVDKWDYFLRDGLSLNIGITFDYRRLMNFCKVMIDSDGVSTIAFRDKEYITLQDMFRMRADLHIRAYQHRVVRNIDNMFVHALLEADEHFTVVGQNSRKFRLSEAHKDLEAFQQLTDNIHLVLQNSSEPKLQGARAVLERIAFRHLYHSVGSWSTKRRLTGNEMHELEAHLGNSYSVAQVCVDMGKYSEPMQKVFFYEKNGNQCFPPKTPTLLWNLPYHKLLIFFKQHKIEGTFDDTRKEVEEFLRGKNVLGDRAEDVKT